MTSRFETIRRAVIYAIPTVWRSVIGFAALPLTTYRLDAADFGLFALITSLSGFAAGASAMGSMYALTSHFPKLDLEGQRDLVSTLLWLGFATGASLAAIVLAAWPVIMGLVPELNQAPAFIIAVAPVLILLGVPWNHASAIILVTGRAKDFAWINLLESIVSVAATLVALYAFDAGVAALFVGALAGALINAIASLFSMRNHLRFRCSRKWMLDSFHVGGLALVCSMLERGRVTVESFALTSYVSVGSVGIYRHSQQYPNLAKSGVNSVAFATWPMALEEARSPQRGFTNVGHTWHIVHFALAFLALGMATLGGDAIGLLTHGKFTEAYVLATFGILIVMFENASKAAVAVVHVHDLGVKNQRIILFANLVALGLMLPLIYAFGVYGAVLTSLASVAMYRVWVVVTARRAAPIPFQDDTAFVGAAVVLVALMVTLAIGQNLPVKLVILAVSAAALVASCKSARQSTIIAFKTRFS